MCAQITRFVKICVNLAKEIVVGRPEPPLKRGDGGFVDWVVLAIQCFRERETETYRSVIDKSKVMGPGPDGTRVIARRFSRYIDAVQCDGSTHIGALSASTVAVDDDPRSRRRSGNRRVELRPNHRQPSVRSPDELSVSGHEDDGAR